MKAIKNTIKAGTLFSSSVLLSMIKSLNKISIAQQEVLNNG